MNHLEYRRKLVEQLRMDGIQNDAVLDSFMTVPREEFLPQEYHRLAYEDSPIPIGNGQTSSQPYTIAVMMQLLDPQPGDVVLEVGTGSGYQAALLAQIVKYVYSVERLETLARSAIKTFGRLRYTNITVSIGDGTCGYAGIDYFDRIIVTAGAPKIPQPLINQLANGGKMVIPVGDFWRHSLVAITKDGDTIQKTEIPGFMFVPLIGECGWEEDGHNKN